MHVIYLPFADDLRSLQLDPTVPGMRMLLPAHFAGLYLTPPPPHRRLESIAASTEQVVSAKKVVKTLRIAFDSHNFENPALQKHYATLQALALDRESIDETPDFLQPDVEGMNKVSSPSIIDRLTVWHEWLV